MGEDRPVFTTHCARAKTTKAACSLCADACPIGAITPGAGGKLTIAASCVECGICTASCPRDGLADPRGRDVRLRNRIRSVRGKSVVFSCERKPVAGSEIASCLAALDPLSLVGLAGRTNIGLVVTDCAGCPLAPGLETWRERFDALLEALPHLRNKVRIAGPADVDGEVNKDTISRRGMLRQLVSMRAAPADSRREAIRAATSGSEVRAHPWLPFGSITISRDCFGCPVCEAVCPENAIERLVHGASITLRFREGPCTACAACVDSCGVRAISLTTVCATVERRKDLIRLDARYCAGCGLEFHSNAHGLCPVCRKAPVVVSPNGPMQLGSGRALTASTHLGECAVNLESQLARGSGAPECQRH